MMVQDSVFSQFPAGVRYLLVLLVSVLSGVLAARGMPRGPVTAQQALLVMGLSLLLGLMAGLLGGSLWMALLVPAVTLLTMELARPDLLGPTVGAVRLDETYGILAFALGRVFPALIHFLSVLLGIRLALILNRLMEETPPAAGLFPGVGPAVSLGLLTAAVIGMVVILLLPGRTPPLTDEEGQQISGSIARLEQVSLGGQPQTILIRAQDPENPVLLYLSGGPGQSDLGYTRVLFENLTDDFVVVSWDQRGTGKSYPALDPADDLTIDQAVADTIELTDYLRERFDEEKIYLIGESYGTLLGVLTVQQRPDLYHAWIASGQMVDIRETDRRLYHRLLEYAEEHQLTGLAAQMKAYGEPPYEDIPFANGTVMGYYEALYDPYTPPRAYIERGTEANLGPMNLFSAEYNLVDRINVLRGLIDMFTIMYPQLQQIDFRQDVRELEVPVYILDGAAEVSARRDLTLEWFELLEAPEKQLFTFENAAHSVAFEQFQELDRILNEVILPATYPDS